MKVVLDSSALLAWFFAEPGGQAAKALFHDSLICAANVSEVIAKLIDKGRTGPEAVSAFGKLAVRTVAFDEALALRAGTLREEDKRQRLSLGDRACLALAERERLPAVTGDRSWAALDLGIEIKLIR